MDIVFLQLCFCVFTIFYKVVWPLYFDRIFLSNCKFDVFVYKCDKNSWVKFRGSNFSTFNNIWKQSWEHCPWREFDVLLGNIYILFSNRNLNEAQSKHKTLTTAPAEYCRRYKSPNLTKAHGKIAVGSILSPYKIFNTLSNFYHRKSLGNLIIRISHDWYTNSIKLRRSTRQPLLNHIWNHPGDSTTHVKHLK